MKDHPEKILWEQKVEDSSYKQNYVPSAIVNATVVAYNTGSETATVNYNIALKSSLAPGNKVQTIAYFAAPLGIIMAVPWILSGWKQRKQN